MDAGLAFAYLKEPTDKQITFIYFLNGMVKETEYTGKVNILFPKVPSIIIAATILSYVDYSK